MRCPKCKKEGVKYLEPRKRSEGLGRHALKRKNFKAKCKKCGWEGEI